MKRPKTVSNGERFRNDKSDYFVFECDVIRIRFYIFYMYFLIVCCFCHFFSSKSLISFLILLRSGCKPKLKGGIRPVQATSFSRIELYFFPWKTSVSDPHKFSCGSGSRIPKMSIWIRIQGGKH